MAESEQERSLFCSSIAELTQTALEQLPNSADLINEKPIVNYFRGLRKLLQAAAASRNEEDWERMYMCLVQYLVTTVRIIPQHNDHDAEEIQDEYNYHKEKVDLVKQEIENLKERLQELYDAAAEAETPAPASESEQTATDITTATAAAANPASELDDEFEDAETDISIHRTVDDIEEEEDDDDVFDYAAVQQAAAKAKAAAAAQSSPVSPAVVAATIPAAVAVAKATSVPAQPHVRALSMAPVATAQQQQAKPPVAAHQRSTSVSPGVSGPATPASGTQTPRSPPQLPSQIKPAHVQQQQEILQRKQSMATRPVRDEDDRAVIDRLTEKVSQQETKKAIKQHNKDAKENKKKNIENKLEEYMDSYRRGERPYIFVARQQTYLRPLPGTIMADDPSIIRARQEMEIRRKLKEEQEKFIQQQATLGLASSIQIRQSSLRLADDVAAVKRASMSMRRTSSQSSNASLDDSDERTSPYDADSLEQLPVEQPVSRPTVNSAGAQRVAEGAMERVAGNQFVQQKAGAAVASLAQNETVQRSVASGVNKLAQNEQIRTAAGNAIASSTDNAMLKAMAQNTTVQKAVATAVQKTVGNAEMQKKVGQAVAKAATNPEVQKKAAQGLLAVAHFDPAHVACHQAVEQRSFLAFSPSSHPNLTMNFGTREKCQVCTKTVYATEKITVDNMILHGACLRCAHCNNKLSLGNYAALEGKIYCKPHFKELFKLKGRYDFAKGESPSGEQTTVEAQQEQATAEEATVEEAAPVATEAVAVEEAPIEAEAEAVDEQ